METAKRPPSTASYLFLSVYGVLACCLAAPMLLIFTVALSSVKSLQSFVADRTGIVLPLPNPSGMGASSRERAA
jgi:hypothetical protein